MAEQGTKSAVNQTSLVATLGDMNKGKDLQGIDAQYAELLESIKRNGGKGFITVKVGVAFMTSLDNDAAQLAMSTECKITKPRAKSIPAVFFVDDRNTVTREDPNQLKLFEERERNSANVQTMVRKEAQ